MIESKELCQQWKVRQIAMFAVAPSSMDFLNVVPHLMIAEIRRECDACIFLSECCFAKGIGCHAVNGSGAARPA